MCETSSCDVHVFFFLVSFDSYTCKCIETSTLPVKTSKLRPKFSAFGLWSGWELDRAIFDIPRSHWLQGLNQKITPLDYLLRLARDWLVMSCFTPYRQYFSHITAEQAGVLRNNSNHHGIAIMFNDWLITLWFTPYRQYFGHITAAGLPEWERECERRYLWW